MNFGFSGPIEESRDVVLKCREGIEFAGRERNLKFGELPCSDGGITRMKSQWQVMELSNRIQKI